MTVEAAETGETLTHVFIVTVETGAPVMARVREALVHFRFASVSFEPAPINHFRLFVIRTQLK